MVVSTGWLGITLSNERMGRNLAIIFGLGAGLIGDEVGLLLTFGDYTSNFTKIFLVSAIAFIILVTLLSRGRKHIERGDQSESERKIDSGGSLPRSFFRNLVRGGKLGDRLRGPGSRSTGLSLGRARTTA